MSLHADLPEPEISFYRTDGVDAENWESAWTFLNEDEKERALRFYFEHDRHRWIRGRAWVKRQLGTVLSLPAVEIPLAAEPGGRLYIPDAPLDFNLSHTGEWIALGICRHGRIGIDIETVDPTFPALEIAREFFLPEEQAWIAAGSIDRFFHLWTAKEALMKATGRGMSLPPDRILVTPNDGEPSAVTNLENGDAWPVSTWRGPGGTMAAFVLT